MAKTQKSDERRQLESEKERLEIQLAELKLEKADADERADHFEGRTNTLEDELAALPAEDAERPLAEPRLLRDPFESSNPHAFKSHPPETRLSWKSPKFRDEHYTWRGWQKVEYTDEIGQNLDKYLVDPPRQMEHRNDNFVTRGDVVLCWLPEEYWLRRRQKSTEKANRLSGDHAHDVQVDGPKNSLAMGTMTGRNMLS